MFVKRAKPENQEKNPQNKDENQQQTQSTWCWVQELNSGHTEGRGALSPLHYPYFMNVFEKEIFSKSFVLYSSWLPALFYLPSFCKTLLLCLQTDLIFVHYQMHPPPTLFCLQLQTSMTSGMGSTRDEEYHTGLYRVNTAENSFVFPTITVNAKKDATNVRLCFVNQGKVKLHDNAC